MAGERLVIDPEIRLQQARDTAWQALNRRDHTVAELQRVLERKRVEPSVIAAVLEELSTEGWLDDAKYAQRFAEDRRSLDAWGPDRIERRLRSLGVDPEHIAAALEDRTQADELEAAVGLLRRRLAAPPASPREAQRALGILVRKGYDSELAYDALRRFAGHSEFDGS